MDRRKSLLHDAGRDGKDLHRIEHDQARSYGFIGDTYLKLGKAGLRRRRNGRQK